MTIGAIRLSSITRGDNPCVAGTGQGSEPHRAADSGTLRDLSRSTAGSEGTADSAGGPDTLVLGVLIIVVMLSNRWGAIILILLGLAAIAASILVSGEWSPVSATVLRRGGDILAFSALTWVVAHAVYAPGRITVDRLQGAVVLYLSLATIFASAFGPIWELRALAPSSISLPERAVRRKSGPCCISASPP
jgi:hypothetical protein